MSITKKQFITAYNKYPPNKWVVFFFKYFSRSTVDKDKYVGKILQGVLITMFLLGMLGVILNWNVVFGRYVTILFSIFLATFVICGFSAVFLNNFRISKICRELGGISKIEYNELVNKFLE